MLTRIETPEGDTKKRRPILSTANILSVLGIAIAIIYGWIGYCANERMEQLSKAQLDLSKKQASTSVDLANFRTLLSKTDTVINELNNQLSLLREQQIFANLNEELGKVSNENKFFFSVQNLQSAIFNLTFYSNLKYNPLWERQLFLGHVDSILGSQLDNPFLMNNKYILKEWMAVNDSLHRYKIDLKIAPYYADSVERKDKAWFNSFFAILKLSNHTNKYMKYYFRNKNKGHLNPEEYIKINSHGN